MRYAIGIDLGGTNIAVGIVTEDHVLLDKDSTPTLARRPWQEVAADMARLSLALVERNGLARTDCAGIGIGSPGICNGETGEVVYSNNLYWEHVPLCAAITQQTGFACRLSNDANCAALGEVVAGAAKGCKNAVLLTLGTGVGGGVIIDGKIYEGQDSAGAELGHSTLISGGVECTCGRKGCIESYVSATGLIRQATEAAAAHPESLLNKERISARSVYEAMRAGDATARAVVAQYEEYLGETITNFVNIFRPEILLLGGGISGEGKKLTDPMNEYVKAHCFGGDKSYITRVEKATLGNQAGIIGAAALCLTAPAAAPLKLQPAYKDYLWGGERLKAEYGKQTELSPLAESWELSCHKDGPSVIADGPYAGKSLAEYIAANPACLGAKHKGGAFPVLIKLIDAAKPLSVQVHPNDGYAQRVEGEPGKTEMWYVADAAPGAALYYGFSREISREEAAKRIADGTLTDVLNAVPVKAGDVFFIEAGTVHAIGAGILIAEIQQNSNTTYRVFDYGRIGADGKPRALHVEKALDVAKLCPPERPVGPMGAAETNGCLTSTLLAACDYFTTRLLAVTGSAPLCAGAESFHSLLCLGGAGAVIWDGKAVAFQKGDSLFLPAGLGDYRIAGDARLILTTL